MMIKCNKALTIALTEGGQRVSQDLGLKSFVAQGYAVVSPQKINGTRFDFMKKITKQGNEIDFKKSMFKIRSVAQK